MPLFRETSFDQIIHYVLILGLFPTPDKTAEVMIWIFQLMVEINQVRRLWQKRK